MVPGCDLNCMMDLWGLERTRSTNEDDSHGNRSAGILQLPTGSLLCARHVELDPTYGYFMNWMIEHKEIAFAVNVKSDVELFVHKSCVAHS